MTNSFLHERCKSYMCQDCVDLAEEYQEIEVRRRAEMIRLDEENERLRAEFGRLKRQADFWEQVARTGLPDIIEAWAAKEIDKVIKSKELDSMKVWINSTEMRGVTDYVVWNYVETPTVENDAVGVISKDPGKDASWVAGNETGTAATIDEAKRIVEEKLADKP